MTPAAPAPNADVPMPPEWTSAILSSSRDFAAIVDGDGVVSAWNGICPCGDVPCPLYSLGLEAGYRLPPLLSGDVLAGAIGSGRHRATVDLPVHGVDVPVEATMTRLDPYPPFLLLALRDVTEATEVAERSALLASEMGHRLSNAYAIAMAILTSSARGADPVGTALRRLEALSRVQAMARGSSTTSLSAVASAIAEGMAAEGVSAPPPDFDADLTVPQAQALLVVSGELCTNSLKHGALRHGGSVRLSWARTSTGCALEWVEESPVPPVRARREGASGFRIMSNMMRVARGRLSDEWARSGLRVVAELPCAVRPPASV